MKENKKMNNTGFIMTKGTMTMETFINVMKDALASRIEGCTVEAHETRKNNGVVLHGIVIREEKSNTSPIIYLDNAFREYRNGKKFEDIVTSFVETYRKNCLTFDFDIEGFIDYEQARKKLCYKLVNTELNKKLLSEVPHIPFHDLSIVFYVLIDSIPGENGSIMVNNKFMDDWGVDMDMLFETAKSNTKSLLKGKITPMNAIIEDILGDGDHEAEGSVPDNDCDMYVATNRMKINGAAVFLYDELLSEFADRVDADFYIIPSSVHELILLPESPDMDPERIKGIIFEVNMMHVKPEEVLSYHLYRYRRDTGRVELVA